jgi:hypothetical protein
MEKLALILTAFNWGAICFVSVVHYPLFADVHRDFFVSYHRKHVTRTTLLLGTTLSLEMVLQLFLFSVGPKDLSHYLILSFLGAGWIITFLVSVPQHRKLEQGFSQQAHQILLLSNWGRVVCWGVATILLAT